MRVRIYVYGTRIFPYVQVFAAARAVNFQSLLHPVGGRKRPKSFVGRATSRDGRVHGCGVDSGKRTKGLYRAQWLYSDVRLFIRVQVYLENRVPNSDETTLTGTVKHIIYECTLCMYVRRHASISHYVIFIYIYIYVVRQWLQRLWKIDELYYITRARTRPEVSDRESRCFGKSYRTYFHEWPDRRRRIRFAHGQAKNRVGNNA